MAHKLSQDISIFQQECDCWHHAYTSVAITNITLEEVVKAARDYKAAEKYQFLPFESSFYNGKEENGVVTFDVYRDDPYSVAKSFSVLLPNSVVYADTGWDYNLVCVMKNGQTYDEFTAKWDNEEPEGYTEDYNEEEEDEDIETHYDCFLTLKDNETGYEFHTGGGMCSEKAFLAFRKLINTHPQTTTLAR